MNEKIEIHNRHYSTRVASVNNWIIPKDLKKDLLRFLEELELGKVNKGVKISEGRRSKYLDLLKVPFEYWNKNIQNITAKDIESFEKDLSKGEIKKNTGEAYSLNTQIDLKKAMKIYFRWKLGEGKALDLVGWLDTRNVERTPDYLKEQDIEKLYKECKTKEQRFLIAVLFDSGARAEEFHNIRHEDIILPEGNNNFVKVALKEEYSKTKGRTIGLFWRYSLEAVREYLNDRISEGMKPKEAIFAMSYDTARRFLYDVGKKVLGRSLHYHLFRHSSATYYADKMNRQQLCIRYGWAFSSRMPDVYISRAGVDEKEMDNKFSRTELSKVKDEIENERQKNSIEMERLKKENETIKQILEKRERYDPLLEKLLKNPKILEVINK